MKLKKYILSLLLLSGMPLCGMQNVHLQEQQRKEQQRIRCVNNKIITAIKNRNINQVKTSIAIGGSINLRNNGVNTALAKAIELIDCNDPKSGLIFLNQLITLGAFVDEQNDTISPNLAFAIDSANLISQAAYYGLEKVVLALSLLGGDVNQKTFESFTPLHIATAEGHATVVDLLYQLGADKEAKNTDGYTPCDYIVGGQGSVKPQSLHQKPVQKPVVFNPNRVDFSELVDLCDDEEDGVVLEETTNSYLTSQEQSLKNSSNVEDIDFGELIDLYGDNEFDQEPLDNSTLTLEELMSYLEEDL